MASASAGAKPDSLRGLDRLVDLAEIKAKSLAYTFNNRKLRTLVWTQRRRERILYTVQKLREKIVRWRLYLGRHEATQDDPATQPAPEKDSKSAEGQKSDKEGG